MITASAASPGLRSGRAARRVNLATLARATSCFPWRVMGLDIVGGSTEERKVLPAPFQLVATVIERREKRLAIVGVVLVLQQKFWLPDVFE
jgi:hypothetical protein